MSRYGRDWDDIQRVRRELRAIVPDMDTSTRAKARADALDHLGAMRRKLDMLFDEWAEIEKSVGADR